MGHHKKQERCRQMDELPEGDGTCSLCHKRVNSLKDHMRDQHRGDKNF